MISGWGQQEATLAHLYTQLCYNYRVRIQDGVMSLFRVALGSQFPTVDVPFVTDCRPLPC